MDLLYNEIDDITLSEVCQAMENEHSALDCLNLMTLTQSAQSYEPDFSDDYLGNFFLKASEVNSEPITEAQISVEQKTYPIVNLFHFV
jgi:hypothetical protein